MDWVDFDALEHQARVLMPPASFAFCAAGADDEISAVENITAWRATLWEGDRQLSEQKSFLW